MLFPLLTTVQEPQLNNDFQTDNHSKRKNLSVDLSEIYKTNKLSHSDDISLSVGYIIFDNIYFGTQINSPTKFSQ